MWLSGQNTKVGLGHEMTRSSTFIFIYTNWKLIIEKSKRLTGIQVTWSRRYLHDLAIFEQLACAHTVHQGHQTWYIFVINIVAKTAGDFFYGTSILVFYSS